MMMEQRSKKKDSIHKEEGGNGECRVFIQAVGSKVE